MPLTTQFSALIMVTSRFEHVRPLEKEDRICRATEENISALVQVGEEVHGRDIPLADIFRARLSRGLCAYLLYTDDTPASYIWLATREYEIYDLRLRIRLGEGVGYYFDVCTGSRFRRRGSIGKLFSYSWQQQSLRLGVICVEESNQAAIAAETRSGFREVNAIVFRRFGPLRIHSLRCQESQTTQRFYSLARIGRGTCLDCLIDEHGIQQPVIRASDQKLEAVHS